jgi:hypothetical protein
MMRHVMRSLAPTPIDPLNVTVASRLIRQSHGATQIHDPETIKCLESDE